MGESADAEAARVMFERCTSGNHDEGEPDARVVGFYERLRSRFPDSPPDDAESPWMSSPLSIGIDHVVMSLSFSPRSNVAIEVIEELAAEFHLVIWDPQSEDAYLPNA